MFSICYFFSLTFKILIDLQQNFLQIDWSNLTEDEAEEWFYSIYLRDNTDSFQSLQLLYFALTSLATVGFGDYTPRSPCERLFIAFGLLFGVLV